MFVLLIKCIVKPITVKKRNASIQPGERLVCDDPRPICARAAPIPNACSIVDWQFRHLTPLSPEKRYKLLTSFVKKALCLI